MCLFGVPDEKNLSYDDYLDDALVMVAGDLNKSRQDDLGNSDADESCALDFCHCFRPLVTRFTKPNRFSDRNSSHLTFGFVFRRPHNPYSPAYSRCKALP